MTGWIPNSVTGTYNGGWNRDVHILTSSFSVDLTILGTPASPAILGSPYLFIPTVYGGSLPYVFSLFSGTLPAGLTLNTSTGAITGNPSSAGTFSGITLRVTDYDLATADLGSFTITVI